jgi:hypothetical protein
MPVAIRIHLAGADPGENLSDETAAVDRLLRLVRVHQVRLVPEETASFLGHSAIQVLADLHQAAGESAK